MIVNNFVYGDANRIFINTDMGCNAGCKYCYLPSLNIVHGERRISVSKAIELVNNLGCYMPGQRGSIISIGCYSECMDQDNITDTIALIKYFVEKKNFVQLATKKKIIDSFFKEIIKYENVRKYLWIYVSLPTITNSHILELGTDSPYDRIKNFDLCRKYGIHNVLYIKPYLNGITIQDVIQYNELIREYNIPVVVGNGLSIEPTPKHAVVGEKRLYEHSEKDMEKFITKIKNNIDVYLHSTDCLKLRKD